MSKDNIQQFNLKIDQHKFWNYYEIKTCLFRQFSNSPWKILFVYVRLLNNKTSPSYLNPPNSEYLRLIHQVHDIAKLNNLLNQLSSNKKVSLGRMSASLDLMRQDLRYEFYPKSYSYPGLFGIHEACYVLSQAGTYTEEFNISHNT
ncbi:MAG TPA: hypothetical protein VJ729_07785 [Nitrososphaeraceae archaeon]|nr:hypothetical protein [Nitrososphaeraceae archaeon]